MNWAILRLYCEKSCIEKQGYYNSQEIGLARELALKNNHITIVYPEQNRKEQQLEELEKGISILRVPCKAFGVHAFYKLEFLLERTIDVVHLNSDNQMFAPSVMRFCRKYGIFFYNYVGTVYSDTTKFWKKSLLNLISFRNICFFRTSPVVAKTTSVKKLLEEKGVGDVEVIPVGMDTTQIQKDGGDKKDIRKELGLPAEKKLLLFVGRLEYYKRPFAALELLKALGRDYYLILIGSGSLKEEIEEKAQHDGLKDRIFYFAQVPNNFMYQYYSACDYYLNFNTHEIFGMSILEAMYQECTVVARRAPGPEEIIEDGISGYLCDSEEGMAQIILKGKEMHIGLNAGKRIRMHFTWEQSAERILRFVNDRIKI